MSVGLQRFSRDGPEPIRIFRKRLRFAHRHPVSVEADLGSIRCAHPESNGTIGMDLRRNGSIGRGRLRKRGSAHESYGQGGDSHCLVQVTGDILPRRRNGRPWLRIKMAVPSETTAERRLLATYNDKDRGQYCPSALFLDFSPMFRCCRSSKVARRPWWAARL